MTVTDDPGTDTGNGVLGVLGPDEVEGCGDHAGAPCDSEADSTALTMLW